HGLRPGRAPEPRTNTANHPRGRGLPHPLRNGGRSDQEQFHPGCLRRAPVRSVHGQLWRRRLGDAAWIVTFGSEYGNGTGTREMTNSEIRMSKEIRNPNDEIARCGAASALS